MEQQTDFKLGKEYINTTYCDPDYLAYMQSTSCEMLSWRKQKLESRLPGEISITSDMQMTPPSTLRLITQKTKIMASDPITSWPMDGETEETVRDFIFGGLQNHCR